MKKVTMFTAAVLLQSIGLQAKAEYYFEPDPDSKWVFSANIDRFTDEKQNEMVFLDADEYTSEGLGPIPVSIDIICLPPFLDPIRNEVIHRSKIGILLSDPMPINDLSAEGVEDLRLNVRYRADKNQPVQLKMYPDMFNNRIVDGPVLYNGEVTFSNTEEGIVSGMEYTSFVSALMNSNTFLIEILNAHGDGGSSQFSTTANERVRYAIAGCPD
jgi:hypothetical protein